MSPKFRTPSLLFPAFILAILCQPAFAQDAAKSQPVARLITASGISPVPKGITSSLPAAPTLADASEIEKRAFEQTNIVRVKNGLAPLVWDGDVCRMARIHSENMSRQKFFAHVTPDGHGLRERARLAGILRFSSLGENIAYSRGYDDFGAIAVERFMTSSKHRSNILSSEYRAMAIGSFVGPDGAVYLTQTFITR